MTTITTSASTTTTKTTRIVVPEQFQQHFESHECVEQDSISDINSALNLPAVDVFINPAGLKLRRELTENQKKKANDYFNEADMKALFPNLFKILWYSFLPCTELPDLSEQFMLKTCHIGGQQVNCSDIFTKVPTDMGMCCAFNSRRPLKVSEYSTLLTKMQDSSDFHATPRGKTSRFPAQAGLKQGLRLTMDLHSNFETFGTVPTDFAAFRVVVGQPEEFPIMEEDSFLVEPGKEHFLSLSSQYFSANGIEGVNPKDRNCFFSNEGNLRYHENYTFSNCLLECGMQHSEDLVECVPWFLPHDAHTATCDPWRERSFMEEFSTVDQNMCQHCLPDCDAYKTSAKISSAKFRCLVLPDTLLLIRGNQGYLWSLLKLGQVKSVQVKSGQVKSGLQVKL